MDDNDKTRANLVHHLARFYAPWGEFETLKLKLDGNSEAPL